MTDLSGNTWLLVGAAIAACTLSVLHSLASRIRNQVNVHDLKINVNRLRIDYARRVREMEEASTVVEGIPVEEFEAEMRQKQELEKLAA